MGKRFKNWPIHPLFLAIFPIFYLYGHNKDLVHPSYLPWPLIISSFFALALFLFWQHFFRNSRKSAVAVSLFLVIFFSFGHYLNFTSQFLTRAPVVNLDYYLLLFSSTAILIIMTVWIAKSGSDFEKVTTYLNYVSVILVLMQLVTIIWYETNSKNIQELISNQNELAEIKNTEEKPDIYYLVLDGYGRQDVLAEYYDHDNESFSKNLQDLGFVVAQKSHANYPQTYLSVASCLNYQYVNQLTDTMGKESDDRGPLKNLIKQAKVFNTLKQAGYKVVAFPYTWSGTYKNIDADIFIQNTISNSSFNDLLIQSTPLRIFSNAQLFIEGYRNKMKFVFNNLHMVAKINSPTFTYVHFLAPHPPFVIDEDGSDLQNSLLFSYDGSHYLKLAPDVRDYRQKYIKQLKYTSASILKAIDKIIANSSTPPVIILQSDHGPGSMLDWEDESKTNMHERMSILNAYYLPEKGKEMLYDTITPVNSFRVVFNTLFDSDLELLEDRSYFARWSRPYDFIDVTDTIQTSQQQER
jgi:hypothetical protein